MIVVPGAWSESDLEYHAENIATMLANNAGFNCNAARVLLLHGSAGRSARRCGRLRRVLARTSPTRRAYYPGAEDRFERFVAAHPEAERIGDARPTASCPWVLIRDLDRLDERGTPASPPRPSAGLFCETAIEAPDAGRASSTAPSRFANERLWGTLNASLIVHPSSRHDPELGTAVERAVETLRYGTVAVNHWAAVGFGLVVTPWGAFPGHTPQDIQSGLGVVHNTMMFSRVQKTVIAAPFHARPKPPWFVTHSNAYELGRRLTRFEASPAAWRLPGIFNLALRG